MEVGNLDINFFNKINICAHSTFNTGFILMILISILIWITTLLTKNYSWVDRLWSILPVFHSFYFSLVPLACGQINHLGSRQIIMLSLIFLWGARLTYNYWRKGGYSKGHEDYRWSYVRSKINSIQFQILNIVFICFLQNVLLFWMATPFLLTNNSDLNFIDIIATILFILSLLLESVADQQQWIFHQNKKQSLLKDKDQFYTDGLFKYSRHPNFFGELSLWWNVYLFSVASTGVCVNWTIYGAGFLTLLFQFSTNLTEEISKGKYPDYSEYQKSTSRIIPWFYDMFIDKKSKLYKKN